MGYDQPDSRLRLTEHLLTFSVAGLLFTAPFSVKFSNIFLVISISLWLITAVNSSKTLRKNGKWIILCCLFFAWQVIGTAYSTDIEFAVNTLSRNAFTLLFALVYFTQKDRPTLEKRMFIFQVSFIGGVLLACVISHAFLFVAIRDTTADWRSIANYEFTYTGLSKFIEFHPSYFSIYILCAICFILFDKNMNRFLDRKYSALKLVLVFYLLFFIFQLATRIGFIVLVEILFLYVAYSFSTMRNKWLSGLILISSITIGTILFFNLPTLKNRFNKLGSSFFSHPGPALVGDDRVFEWECALSSINGQMFLAGYGTGDTMIQMLKCYERKGYEKHFAEELNTHNQYLAVILSNGLIGLCFFLFVLFKPLFGKPQDYFLCLAIVIILTTFALTESFLVVRKGGFLWGYLLPMLWSKAAFDKIGPLKSNL